MDMRQYISQKLDGMKSLAEKEMLRDVMEGVFIPLYDHTEAQYARLENRVKDELPPDAGPYAIWTTLLERGNADGGCPYLFPMRDGDIQKTGIELPSLEGRLTKEKEIRLDTVLIQADYLICKEIEDGGEIFEGTLRSNGGDFRIGVRLRRAKRYSGCVESLYRLFISNGVPWRTVNSPYMFKMFDVMLARVDTGGGEAPGEANGYEAKFGKYAGYVRHGLVPVWNVCRLRMKSEDFPLAALDKVNYEYVFDLGGEGAEHGYIADYGNVDISAVRRERDTLVVTSPAKKGLVWDMHKIVKRTEYEAEYFPYELMSNAQEDSFAARMAGHYGAYVKTGAELRRLLSSYGASGHLEFVSAKVVPGAVPGETYEVNGFLKDELRDLAVSKSLLLEFRGLKRGSSIARDVMSFLVSQTQLVYPEFNCVGVLV